MDSSSLGVSGLGGMAGVKAIISGVVEALKHMLHATMLALRSARRHRASRVGLFFAAISLSFLDPISNVQAHDYVPPSAYTIYFQDCGIGEVFCTPSGSFFRIDENGLFSTFLQSHNQFYDDGASFYCYGSGAPIVDGWIDISNGGQGVRQNTYSSTHECHYLPSIAGICLDSVQRRLIQICTKTQRSGTWG